MELFYVSNKRLDVIQSRVEGVKKEIDEALKVLGELSKDNSSLKDNNAFIEQRGRIMRELPQRLGKILPCDAEVVFIEDMEEYKNFDGKVIRGSEVEIKIGKNDPRKFKILGSFECDVENDVLSCKCDLALALLGKRAGSEINFRGEKITILSVKRV